MNRLACNLLALLFAGSGCIAGAQASDEPVIASAMIAKHRAATRTETPTGPIELSYEFLEPPELNQSARVRITASWQLPLGHLEGSIYAQDGMLVTPSSFSLSDLSSVQTVEQILTVTPAIEGSLRFSVTLAGEVDGQRQAALLVVPLDTGPAQQAAQPMGILSEDENGEKIIRLRAGQAQHAVRPFR